MKVVGVSDLHGYLPGKSRMPAGDILCICGDTVPLDYQRSDVKSLAWFLQDFTPWVDKLPYEYVLMIPGNHDFIFEDLELGLGKNGSDLLKAFYLDHKGKHSKLKLLCDSSFEYDGKRFYGTPWCPDLRGWAYYGTHEDLVERFNRIPKRCSVLLSHCPPKVCTVGTVLQTGWNYGKDFGCQELADALQDREIDWVLCGHVHSGSHGITYMDKKKVVNVSLKDEDYKVNYEPFVFEI